MIKHFKNGYIMPLYIPFSYRIDLVWQLCGMSCLIDIYQVKLLGK